MIAIDDVVSALRSVGSGWWSAAAAAAGAGAVLFPGSRVGAGVLAGAAVLALAVYQKHTGACCAECAASSAAKGAVEMFAAPLSSERRGGLDEVAGSCPGSCA